MPNGIDAIGPFVSYQVPNYGHPQFKGPTGMSLVGNIVGILKKRGDWAAKELETVGEFNVGDEYCAPSFSLQTAIGFINSTADFTVPNPPYILPPLSCSGLSNYGGGGSLGSGSDACLGLFPNGVFNSADSLLTAYLNTISACYCENYDIIACSTSSTLSPWLDLIAVLTINDLNNGGQNPIVINTSDLFENNNGNGIGGNGKFKGLSLTLEPGLYNFGMQLKDGNYTYRVMELKTTLNELVRLSDLINITVFPNPIVNNKFDIKFKAQATLSFNYELRDFSGNVILTRNYVVHKDEEKSFQINHNNLPSGILFHRFIFEDGSSKTVQTLKN